jgi:poly-gamma-glutamate synthesis protein (capsule biosynthesis protein)
LSTATLEYTLTNKVIEQQIRATTTTAQIDSTIAIPPVYFTGDSMLGRHVEQLLDANLVKPYDFFKLFASSSAVVTNFESAIASPHIKTPSGQMRFSTKPEHIKLLEALQVTHSSLANNHSRDYGMDGYINAKRALLEANIVAFGDAVTVSSSSLTFLSLGDSKVAILGVHTLFESPDRAVMTTLLEKASLESDFQFVYIHWGEEYELTHNLEQEDLATWFVKHGVDAVIGHHPHVVQDIGHIEGVPIFYSLGNFIFDQYFSPDVKTGLVLGLEVSNSALLWRLYPHTQCAKATPCRMAEVDEKSFLAALASRSDEALQEQIMAKNIEILIN